MNFLKNSLFFAGIFYCYARGASVAAPRPNWDFAARAAVATVGDVFVEAIKTKDVERVKLLTKKFKINMNDKWAGSFLHAAIDYDVPFEIAEILIKNGFDLNNTVDDYYHTALMKAVYDKKINWIEFLLAHGADVNAKNYQKETALHIALKYENRAPAVPMRLKLSETRLLELSAETFKIVNLLLDMGADINVPMNLDLPVVSLVKGVNTVKDIEINPVQQRALDIAPYKRKQVVDLFDSILPREVQGIILDYTPMTKAQLNIKVQKGSKAEKYLK